MDNFEKICPSSQSANQGTDTSSAVINDDTNGNLSGGYLQKYFNGAGLLAQGTSYCLLICWEVDNLVGGGGSHVLHWERRRDNSSPAEFEEGTIGNRQ